MLPWSEVIDPVADQAGFAGVVSVHRGAETEFARAYGLADRACQIPNTVRTRFAIASGTQRRYGLGFWLGQHSGAWTSSWLAEPGSQPRGTRAS